MLRALAPACEQLYSVAVFRILEHDATTHHAVVLATANADDSALFVICIYAGLNSITTFRRSAPSCEIHGWGLECNNCACKRAGGGRSLLAQDAKTEILADAGNNLR